MVLIIQPRRAPRGGYAQGWRGLFRLSELVYHFAYGIFVSSGYAYVAHWRSGLQIIDISVLP